jgi:hypothetical protein
MFATASADSATYGPVYFRWPSRMCPKHRRSRSSALRCRHSPPNRHRWSRARCRRYFQKSSGHSLLRLPRDHRVPMACSSLTASASPPRVGGASGAAGGVFDNGRTKRTVQQPGRPSSLLKRFRPSGEPVTIRPSCEQGACKAFRSTKRRAEIANSHQRFQTVALWPREPPIWCCPFPHSLMRGRTPS